MAHSIQQMGFEPMLTTLIPVFPLPDVVLFPVAPRFRAALP